MNQCSTLITSLVAEIIRLSECAAENAAVAETKPAEYVNAVRNHFLQLIPALADIRKAHAEELAAGDLAHSLWRDYSSAQTTIDGSGMFDNHRDAARARDLQAKILARVQEEVIDTGPTATAARPSARQWEQALSAVMPPDFKDWWQNSPAEWPSIAAGVIATLRDRESLLLEHAGPTKAGWGASVDRWMGDNGVVLKTQAYQALRDLPFESMPAPAPEIASAETRTLQ